MHSVRFLFYTVQNQAELSNADASGEQWLALREKGKFWEHKGSVRGAGDVLVSDLEGGPQLCLLCENRHAVCPLTISSSSCKYVTF